MAGGRQRETASSGVDGIQIPTSSESLVFLRFRFLFRSVGSLVVHTSAQVTETTVLSFIFPLDFGS